MIELVLLGSLVLLGLHFLTRRRVGEVPAPVAEPPAAIATPKRPKRPKQDPPDPAEAYDFEILYREEDGTERPRRIAQVRHEGTGAALRILCHCAEARGPVTLRNDRILSCRNLRSGRAIKDLGRYCQARTAKKSAR
ncbi:hypothetical protein [Falsirhodobacter sp. 20TX0035]|uniref:hypothetical protein n=1 Tax=Falsirhodobacter sp. 20TX0035 TaxID=3022019 RepID=UPI00232AB661|nr:hypothetical protein [Falsirhodobacter sp. 20TX0035]MDB6453720.1 hypothetical protein [Falsirhodobacter sp. 20TX0035]